MIKVCSRFEVVIVTINDVSIDKKCFLSWMLSDLIIKLNGKELPGHKFVLAARSDYWGTDDLNHVSELDLSGKTVCHH